VLFAGLSVQFINLFLHHISDFELAACHVARVVLGQASAQEPEHLCLVVFVQVILLGGLDHIEKVVVVDCLRDEGPDESGQVEKKRLNAEEDVHPLVVLEDVLAPGCYGEHVVVVGLVDVIGALEPAVALHVGGVSAELGGHPAVDRRVEEAAEGGENYEEQEEVGGEAVGEAVGEVVVVVGLLLRGN